MKRFFYIGNLILLGIMTAGFVYSQTPQPKPTPKKVPVTVPKPVVKDKTPEIPVTVVIDENTPNDFPTEKAIEVDSKVTISLCVNSAKVKVNGWNRNEVRAFVEGGSGSLGFNILQKNKENRPNWVMVLPFEQRKGPANECFDADEIQLEVPNGARVDIKSENGDSQIESVAKTHIASVGGSIILRDIREEIESSSLSGDIKVEDSTGKVSVKSVSGQIVLQRLEPNEIGDACRVKSSSGDLILQDVKHTSLEAGTINGEIVISGSPQNGSRYDLSTTSGNILLMFADDDSFKISATFSFGGNFVTNFKLDSFTNVKQGNTRKVSGIYSTGGATINLTSFNGNLTLKRANVPK
jgi:hypothetical protein